MTARTWSAIAVVVGWLGVEYGVAAGSAIDPSVLIAARTWVAFVAVVEIALLAKRGRGVDF